MPAIVDHGGPGGRPISVFESGAILQYLGRKTGKFYPATERARVEVDQWLFWQMANLGPKAGEANHFRRYAPEKSPYAIERFSNEMNRLLWRHEHAVEGSALPRAAPIRLPTWPASAGSGCSSGKRKKQTANNSRASRISSAGLPQCGRGLPSSAACTSASRRRAAVDVNDPKVRAVLFGQRAR